MLQLSAPTSMVSADQYKKNSGRGHSERLSSLQSLLVLSNNFCPNTTSSTSCFFPRNFSQSPHTGVRNGTNIATRAWYALYASGYLESEMLSVKIVEEKKSVQSTSEGASGQIGAIDVGGKSCLGDSGARRGIRFMIACSIMVSQSRER